MTIVADDFCIINTMGIRYVQKINHDTAYMRDPTQSFGLTVHYKGTHQTFNYPTRELRDKHFEALREAMISKKNG